MRGFVPVIVFVVVLGLLVLMMACNTFSTLQLVVDMAAEALDVLEAAGVGGVTPEVVGYVEGVAGCISGIKDTSTTQEWTQVTTCLMLQKIPSTAGMSPAIVRVIADVAAAVDRLVGKGSPKELAPGRKLATPDQMKLGELRDRAASISFGATVLKKVVMEQKGEGKNK